MLSIDTVAKRCGTRSDNIPFDMHLLTTCVARWLTVSKHAAAPSLFRILTNSCIPPWHNTVSVTTTCSGVLHAVFVQNRQSVKKSGVFCMTILFQCCRSVIKELSPTMSNWLCH